MACWLQFVSQGLPQFPGRASLRDVISDPKTPTRKLYHLSSRLALPH
jgi:Domain of unknown function (DUF4372)